MISYDEAITIIRNEGGGRTPETEMISIEDISGRIAAVDITTSIANQPFDNSAMDGFALRADDLISAKSDNPVLLQVIGLIAAGAKPPTRSPAHGQCYQIMTGAPLPQGCDTVVPVEKSEQAGEGKVKFSNPAGKGDHIRRVGEDFAAGDILIPKNTAFHAGHVMLLATAGISEIEVFKSPKVGLVSTGLEIVDDFSASLEPGQIYNSSGPYLRALLREKGLSSISYGTVGDEEDIFKSRLKQALADKCDIIISTGAVSAGVYDFVPSVLKELEAEILFHKVAIRPGKPILFAKFPNGGPFFFGLPGNPVSTSVGWRFFVEPLVRSLQGLAPEQPLKAILKDSYNNKKAGLTFFLRAILNHTEKAINEVEIPKKQQSFMVSPFASANVWAVLPEGVSRIEAGDIIEVYPL